MSTPGTIAIDSTEYDSFFQKIVITAYGCWEWIAGKTNRGYAAFYPNGRKQASGHRWAYEACVNPMHLDAVTRRVNVLRGQTLPAANAAKTHCIHGHEYTEANTIRHKYGRQCRTCKNIYQSRHGKEQRQEKRRL